MKQIRIQKSNKIKKRELQDKKRTQNLHPTTAPKIIYCLHKKVRNLPAAIEAAFNGEKFPDSERKIHNILNAIKNTKNPEFLKEIFLHFANLKIEFADVPPNQYGRNHHREPRNSTLTALVNLARYQEHAIRPVKDWKPPSHNVPKSVASFARHLYGKYPVPAFMDTAWYDEAHANHRNWFIHVAQGQNIRTANGLPVPLTKKEAHLMMEAPRDFGILNAIRYGQILNIGGNEVFVRQIMRTRIAVDFAYNEFWMSVFRWLMQNPMLDFAHYAPIVDFIHNQKFVPCRMENGNMVCAQPNMSMKGRDPETMLRQVEQWHKQTGKEGKGQFAVWPSSGIKPFYAKTDNNVFTIQEICTYKDLLTEGKSMRHCVGSYAGSCAQGRVSIWKFEQMTNMGIEKRLTIEVSNRDKTITQARGKFNAVRTASDMAYLNRWARDAGLSLSRYMI